MQAQIDTLQARLSALPAATSASQVTVPQPVASDPAPSLKPTYAPGRLGDVLSAHLSTEQQHQVVSIFDRIDTDGGGSLGQDEVNAFFSPGPGQPGRLPRALQLLDADEDGVITWAEWVSFFEELHRRERLDGTLKLLAEITDSK